MKKKKKALLLIARRIEIGGLIEPKKKKNIRKVWKEARMIVGKGYGRASKERNSETMRSGALIFEACGSLAFLLQSLPPGAARAPDCNRQQLR